MQKNYGVIDILKLFFAVTIVALHTAALNDFSPAVGFTVYSLFSRIAVPFFFCASGFFLFSKLEHAGEKQWNIIRKQATRILILYGIWTGLKFLYYLGRGILQKNGVMSLVGQYFSDLIRLNDGPYWYLQVLLIATILLGLLCNSKRKLYVTTGVFAVCYCFFMLLNYTATLQLPFPVFLKLQQFFAVREYIFKLIVGGLFCSIGGTVSYEIKQNNSSSPKRHFVFLGLGLLLLIAEIFVILYSGRTDLNRVSYFIALPLIAASLLKLALTADFSVKHGKLYRNLSVLIYVTHYMIRGVVNPLVHISYFVYFLGCLAVSVLVSYLIIKLSEKYRVFGWLY